MLSRVKIAVGKSRKEGRSTRAGGLPGVKKQVEVESWMEEGEKDWNTNRIKKVEQVELRSLELPVQM